MKKNIFEIGAIFEDDWLSDNKVKQTPKVSSIVKPPDKHQLHFAREKRRGKVVTVVKHFYLDKNNRENLLKVLKKKLGTGGTVRDDSLEFQGDIQESLRGELEFLGFRFKK